uniref:KRAB domain-containing protein n=1 Tax=Crocodylus porosus TaxID=8502 RepID=A0A7M4E7L8_CROPO
MSAARLPGRSKHMKEPDVAVYFTRKEWELLEDGDKVLYQDQMLRNYHTLVSLGKVVLLAFPWILVCRFHSPLISFLFITPQYKLMVVLARSAVSPHGVSISTVHPLVTFLHTMECGYY